MPTISIPEHGLTVTEAARALNVSDATVRMALHRGVCPATRVLGRVRLTATDLEQYVRARSR